MMTEDMMMGLDGSSLIPVQFGGTLVSSPRIHSSSVIELGKKLLHCAREGDTESILDLMGKGAPFSSDWLGTTALHLAAMNDHIETCDILLRAGISRDTRTKVDRTPLHFAAYEGHAKICRLLLEYEADVDSQDMLKMTPLHWAVEKGHTKCVEVLLEYGADPNLVSKFHKTPLSLAAESNNEGLLSRLQLASFNKSNSYRELEQNNEEQDVVTEHCEQITDNGAIEEIVISDEKHIVGNIAESMEADVQTNFEQLLPKISNHANEATLQLLREHGITMLPADPTNTVTTALQSGRTIVLSDAGKLLLQETKPKQIQVKKKPLILPANKMRNHKVYTLSSSQFMALTAQNKQSIQRIPLSAIKKVAAGSGMNLVQICKGKISKIATMQTAHNNSNISVNMASLNQGELNNMQQLQNHPKQIIQLRNNKMPSGFRIIMNKNNVGKIFIPKSLKMNHDDTKTSTNMDNCEPVENRLNYEDLVTDDLSYSNMSNEELKKLLRTAKDDIEQYKSRLELTEKQLDICRKRLRLYERETID